MIGVSGGEHLEGSFFFFAVGEKKGRGRIV